MMWAYCIELNMLDNQHKSYLRTFMLKSSKGKLKHKSISEAYYQISEDQSVTLYTERTDMCFVLSEFN
jgi:hypothetical protein